MEASDGVLHAGILWWLNHKNLLQNRFQPGDDPLDWIEEFICLDRANNTNVFLFAESYDMSDIREEFEEEINNYKKQIKKLGFTLRVAD